ncbi:hypothetical protein ASD25_04455 [Brevundimonas sp. Root1423]|nr:hypothetical protein ASD25_04455 [Brevundimonas sp. Root1423]
MRRLGWALGSLPVRERDDILRETRSHIDDRVAEGVALETVLQGFGPAERYARQFIDEIEAYEALGSQRAADLALFVANRAHRSGVAAFTLLLLLLLGVLAAITVLMVGLKIYDPVHTGLWVGQGGGFVGIIDDAAAGRELMGPWLFPISALLLTLVAVCGRLLLSFVVPLLKPRPDRPVKEPT